MAERGVLRSAYRTEVADRRRSISAEFAALLAAAEQRIIAHVQGKIAAIDPALSMAARHAAIEQFIAEQTAAILQLKQDIKQQRRHARRLAGTSFRGKFKKRRRALVARHVLERQETRATFGTPHVIWQRPARAFTAIRRTIPRLKLRAARHGSVMRPRR